MKTVRVKVNKRPLSIEEISMEHTGCGMLGAGPIYTYTVQTTQMFDHESEIEVYQYIEVPEKLKEFLELKGLSKDELVEWLNANYEK